jgi:hypothetical protein
MNEVDITAEPALSSIKLLKTVYEPRGELSSPESGIGRGILLKGRG